MGSRLKFLFRWIAQFLILFKLYFKLIVYVFMSWSIERSEATSAKSLTCVVKSLERSLISIKNSSGSRINPWCTLALMIVHKKYCPFKTSLCFLKFKKSVMISKIFPKITFYFSLHKSPLCHTLSNALEVPQDHRQKFVWFHYWWREVG